jgi:hypothetical protein
MVHFSGNAVYQDVGRHLPTPSISSTLVNLTMPKDAQSVFNDFVRSLLGRPISYVSLFANSIRVCVDRELGEKTGFFLWFEPVWHLGSPEGILLGSRQAQTDEREAHAALNLSLQQKILGRQVERISVEALTTDIDIRFSGGCWVRTFVSDPTVDESWYFRDCQSDIVVTGSPKGVRLAERSARLHEGAQ